MCTTHERVSPGRVVPAEGEHVGVVRREQQEGVVIGGGEVEGVAHRLLQHQHLLQGAPGVVVVVGVVDAAG